MNRVALVLLCALLLTVAPAGATEGEPGSYLVRPVRNRVQRTAVARTGASIDEVQPAAVVVTATDAERDELVRRGFTVEPVQRPLAFPPADSAYHDYAEMVSDVNAVAAAHPSIVHLLSIGSSHEGRDLIAARVSDDAVDDRSEPGVLFVGQHHAREHLTVEVVLGVLHMFAESTDTSVQNLVRARQIYIVPSLNPDGGEHDIGSGSYKSWRKNRQPNAGSSAIGTDENRNYSYRWGCCGGSSGNTGSLTYRGPAPFSTPETAALRDFVLAHDNITTALSYHSYGRLILYPYGYTYNDVPSDMTQVDHDAFVAMGQAMAGPTGYRPQQASDLYITDGDFNDWMYGDRHMYPFTFELGGSGFYPGDEIIPSEVAKNLPAATYLAQMADCPLRAAGAACDGSPPPQPPQRPPPVVNGGFESGLSGWTSAGGGAVPAPVHGGVGAARLGGAARAKHTLTQTVTVPAGGRLSLWIYVDGADSAASDWLRVLVGKTSTPRITARSPHGVWQNVTLDVSAQAGRTVTLKVETKNSASLPTSFYVDDVALS